MEIGRINVIGASWMTVLQPKTAALTYLLRGWDSTVGNQSYTDGQTLDTVAELGDKYVGQFTVVEVDGTLSVAGNKMTFTAQSSPVWGDLGAYSGAQTRALGRALIGTVNLSTDGSSGILVSFNTGIDLTTYEEAFYFHGGVLRVDSAHGWPVVAGSYSTSTDYEFAIVLGGADSNAVPWRSGETAANYLYGASYFIKGGAFTNWTLLWRSWTANASTLYAVISNHNSAGTLSDFRAPDKDLSAVLQPTCLSTFDAANGTSLDAITPEVGGTWTEQAGDFDIQSNRATSTGSTPAAPRWVSTTDSAISDAIVDVTTQTTTTSKGIGLIVRFTDTSNLWYIDAEVTDNNLYIIERNGASNTVRASVGVTLNASTDYDIRVILDSSTIDAFVDGGSKVSYGSATHNQEATKHGIYTNVNTATYENFAVYSRTSTVYDDELDAV